jgi:hypothetical protein
VQPFVEQARNLLLRDLDPDFIESVAVGLGWEYNSLYERLADDPSLMDCYREEEFNKRRGDCAVRAIARAAIQHGIPHEFRRLDCNGQRKLLVKAGRVILIQESILTLGDQPSTSDYKMQLADMHGFVRQLELDLGDQPTRIRDWSGCVLGVLLHGAAGRKFDRGQKSLGSAMLAVPDSAYSQWILRLDLHSIAMFGRNAPKDDEVNRDITQDDEVVVTSKRRNSEAEFG